jgi:diguanylate cyclase (GGDEF)-like protein/PAS domain S-box-containing protein
MQLTILPHQIVMILATILAIIVVVVGWSKRRIHGGGFFIGFSTALVIWLIGSTVETIAVAQSEKIFWSQFSYIGFVQAIPFLFLFTTSYVQQKKQPWLLIGALFIIPFVTLAMAWTNGLHGWLWSGYSAGSVDYNVLIYHHGFWFWIHTAYLYLLLFAGIVLVFKNFFSSSSAVRHQLLILLLSVVFPMITGTAYAIGFVPVEGLDITPTGLVFTGAILVWGLLRHQLLDLLPVARAALIEQLQDGVMVLDMHGRILDINKALQKLLGWDPQKVLGLHLENVFPEIHALFIASDQPIRREIPLPESPGVVLEIQVSTLFNKRREQVGKLIVARDVTSRNLAEAELQRTNQQLKETLEQTKDLQIELERMAMHDSLTGLYNRHIDDILIKEFSRARRDNKPVSLAMVDIDHFKNINDTYGHHVGDRILQAFGQALLEQIRVEDYAARYGGDEILLVFPGMHQTDAVKKATEIRKNFENLEVEKEFQKGIATITIGVATFPQDGDSVEAITKAADQALYVAKQRGRNQVAATENL